LYRSRFLGGSTAQILEELGLDTLLLNFRDDLTNTDHAYEQIQTTSMTDFQYHREIIQKQVWANVVSADLLAHIARLEHIARPEYEFAARLAPPPSLARRAVDKLSSILQENPFPIISIAELIMVKYYRRMITRREAKRAMSEVRRPPNGISEPLTDLDDAELNYFSGTLEQATNATGGRQFQIDEKARDETDLGVVVC
jgi:hypothetical protein